MAICRYKAEIVILALNYVQRLLPKIALLRQF